MTIIVRLCTHYECTRANYPRIDLPTWPVAFTPYECTKIIIHSLKSTTQGKGVTRNISNVSGMTWSSKGFYLPTPALKSTWAKEAVRVLFCVNNFFCNTTFVAHQIIKLRSLVNFRMCNYCIQCYMLFTIVNPHSIL